MADTDIATPRQHSLESYLLKKNQDDGKDLRDDLPITIVLPGDMKTSLKDIGGYEEAKTEIIEYINFIKHQDMYKKLGARMPKGALLDGPPGTGKTLLARAIAGEANIPFIACSSASLLLGSEGPTKLRRIFEVAYSMSPCVLFLDEVDTIGRDRDHDLSTPVTQCITEELLVQLDGFHKHEDALIIVLAATNCKKDLDKAIVRPGRFDRVVEMPRPDEKERAAILAIHLENIRTFEDKAKLATRMGILTVEMTGAHLAAVCNEAAMIAARTLNESVETKHFDQALFRVHLGLNKGKPVSRDVLERAAMHDAAHAVAAWYLKGTELPSKLSLMPNPLGRVACSQNSYKCTFPNDKTRVTAKDTIAVALAGAAAEKLLYGEHYTSCKRDFKAATELTWQYMTECGMSEQQGMVHTQYAHMNHGCWEKKPKLGPEAGDITLDQVKKVLDESFEVATGILQQHQTELKQISQLLMEKEFLTSDVLAEFFESGAKKTQV